MRRLAAVLTALLCFAAPPAAQDRPGAFDYYLLALSWSPSWCALEGDARSAAVCAEGSGSGFTLHGLWPQHEQGWPEFCSSERRDPTRGETAAMADIMGSAGLAWHQWVRHGRCTGLAPTDYFALSRTAFAGLTLPESSARTTAAALEAAVVALNDIPADSLIVTCRSGLALELRLCLTRDLAPRPCASDVLARACRPDRLLEMPPAR